MRWPVSAIHPGPGGPLSVHFYFVPQENLTSWFCCWHDDVLYCHHLVSEDAIMMILKIFVGVDDGVGGDGGDNDDANGSLACIGLGAGLVCKMHSTLRDALNPWIA